MHRAIPRRSLPARCCRAQRTTIVKASSKGKEELTVSSVGSQHSRERKVQLEFQRRASSDQRVREGIRDADLALVPFRHIFVTRAVFQNELIGTLLKSFRAFAKMDRALH